ncbi:uncharacterized protein LOC133813900 [Humulus lupulus]|uniref:uncharacterized protein LOC133813900 n=1 Tax=Humulus lupulus TaxID=3486 RepID=UPI002B416B0F|nr:uncharacterized protein LOC133813900 [Humulus lupulus]
MTPFQAVYGHLPPSILSYTRGTTTIQVVEEDLLSRDAILHKMKENLIQARNRMQQQANKKRHDIQFQIGDLVLVKLQPYRQLTVAHRLNIKLCRRFFGPFEILARVGPVAYTLKLPQETRIHPTSHVSLLKPYHGTLPPSCYQLPEMYELPNLEDKVNFMEGRSVSEAQTISPIELDPRLAQEIIRKWLDHSAQEAKNVVAREESSCSKEEEEGSSSAGNKSTARNNRTLLVMAFFIGNEKLNWLWEFGIDSKNAVHTTSGV